MKNISLITVIAVNGSRDKKVEMNQLKQHKQDALEQAIDALSRYKFMMFGYWAAIWVHLNQIDDNKEPNPFKSLVECSRNIQKINQGQGELKVG